MEVLCKSESGTHVKYTSSAQKSQIFYCRGILKFSRLQGELIRSMMPIRKILLLYLFTSITHQFLNTQGIYIGTGDDLSICELCLHFLERGG